MGLIDETAIDKADAVAKCKAFIKKFDNITSFPRELIKQNFRADAINRLQTGRKEDTAKILEFITNHAVQQNLEMSMQALKNKDK